MTITLPANLAEVLNAFAIQRGTTVEALAVEALVKRFGTVVPPIPKDEWERRLFSMGIDCGVSLTDEQLSREALYD